MQNQGVKGMPVWQRVVLLVPLLGLSCLAEVAAADALDERVRGVATYRCGGCHGQGGQGANPMFPKLAGQNADYLMRQILNFKSGERRGAVMFYQLGDLSATDIRGLAEYFSRQILVPSPIFDRAVQKTGRALYFEGNPMNAVAACVQCHGADARGSGLMPRIAGQHAEYIAEQIYRFIDSDRLAGQTRHHPDKLLLTHDEIRAVSVYLSSLD